MTFWIGLTIFTWVVVFTFIRKLLNNIRTLRIDNEEKQKIIEVMSTEEHLEIISKNIGTLAIDVHDIKNELFTNDKTGRPGLAERHNDLAEKVDKMSSSMVTKNNLIKWIGGISTGIVGASHFIKDFFSK